MRVLRNHLIYLVTSLVGFSDCSGTRMSVHTVRYFSRAIKAGSKYIYQTVPRLLTLWLDMGEEAIQTEALKKMNIEVSRAIEAIPTYKVC